MSLKKSVLVVSAFFPYPTLFGGAYDIWEKIKGLHRLGLEVHLLFTAKTKPKEVDVFEVEKYVSKLYFVQRKNRIIDLFSQKPLQIMSRKGLESIIINRDFDFILLESEYVSLVLKNKTFNAKKYILRVHNDESKYFNELSKSTSKIFKKAYYFSEEIKFKRLRSSLYNKIDRLWFISLDELERLGQRKNNAIHLPPPINQKFVNRDLKGRQVLFVGSLYMDNNLEAILWYLKNVHDFVANEFLDYKLIICGSTGDKGEEYFRALFSKYERIDLQLNIKDLEVIYNFSSVFINPMRHGTGVKLKSINAIVNGLPVISTTIGSEGVGLINKEMFFEANTPEEFKINTINLLKTKDKSITVIKAQEHLRSTNYLTILEKEIKSLDVRK
ncbi:glycosyltransferase [Formosa algae]|uniref:Glycosyltransferase n=1 Tax=Formosa algae TaxID=225843 RepID=A0A9X1C851_9FLAO|nr:glycosyltransferase [Formosa algae]MBP1838711.1 hypothetical protein [Formosa algae]MDQ0335211.1 hypothetical protein [Formosa algae]OEI81645.1 hypothetical protein AST99_02900 [Formosa algae]